MDRTASKDESWQISLGYHRNYCTAWNRYVRRKRCRREAYDAGSSQCFRWFKAPSG